MASNKRITLHRVYLSKKTCRSKHQRTGTIHALFHAAAKRSLPKAFSKS